MSAQDQPHYFSESPETPLELKRIHAFLAGEEREMVTANGVFSGDHLDKATRILLDEVPDPPTRGHGLDLGTGWGPIALDMALRSPDALKVWAVDVNDRALDLARQNTERHAAGRVEVTRPEGVPEDIRFSVIWSNPPIRIGKEALHELLSQWLPRLELGGVAWLVVAKQLGADSLLTWMQAEFADWAEAERTATAKGFRILRIERMRETTPSTADA